MMAKGLGTEGEANLNEGSWVTVKDGGVGTWDAFRPLFTVPDRFIIDSCLIRQSRKQKRKTVSKRLETRERLEGNGWDSST